MGILSKHDLIDADMLTRYGLLNRKLIAYQPETQEISDLRSLLNRLYSLEQNLRRELNRQEKIGRTSVIHPLEKKSLQRSVKQLEAEIVLFKKQIRETIKTSTDLKRDYDLLLTIPGVGAKTAWMMIVILGSCRFESAPEVASFLGLNPIEKQSGTTRYRRPRLSKAGNGRFRQALYFPSDGRDSKEPGHQSPVRKTVGSRESQDVRAWCSHEKVGSYLFWCSEASTTLRGSRSTSLKKVKGGDG